MLEIGINQLEDVTNILKADGYNNVDYKKDLGGIPRVVFAQK